MEGSRYDPDNLPLRTHEHYIRDFAAVECSSGSSRTHEVQKRGKL